MNSQDVLSIAKQVDPVGDVDILLSQGHGDRPVLESGRIVAGIVRGVAPGELFSIEIGDESIVEPDPQAQRIDVQGQGCLERNPQVDRGVNASQDILDIGLDEGRETSELQGMSAPAQGADVTGVEGLAPDCDIVDLALKVITCTIVGEADMDLALPVEIRGRLGASPDQRTIDVDLLPSLADDVGGMVPLAICEIPAGGGDGLVVPDPRGDIAAAQVDMPVMTAGTEVSIDDAEKPPPRGLRPEPERSRIGRLGDIDHDADVIV